MRTSRTAEGSAIAGIDVAALIDHVNPQRVRDSASARLRGVELPTLDIPGLPFRLNPGRGAARLDFALRNDQLAGRWSLSSNQVAWALDSAGRKLNTLEGLVWRVVSGLKDLSVDARVSGGLRSPKLAVSSNLDRAIAERLQAVIGEEVAKAEKMVRAKVDSAVAERVEPVRRQIARGAERGGDAARARSGSRSRTLSASFRRELKRLTGGLAPDIKLPKIGI